MAHILSKYLKLWKPQNLTIDKISSQKMFIDNIDAMEDFAKVTMQKVHKSVKSIADLRAINTSDSTLFTTGMLIMVQDKGMYSFNRSSTAVDDGNASIAPTTGGGRWLTTQVTDIILSTHVVNDNTEFDALLTDVLSQMSIDSIKFIAVRVINGGVPISSNNIGFITIYKSNNSYATVTMTRYDSSRIAAHYTRTIYEGTWGKWVALPYLDENGKIPLSLLPESILAANTLANAEIIEE